jgi:hypothetical protein
VALLFISIVSATTFCQTSMDYCSISAGGITTEDSYKFEDSQGTVELSTVTKTNSITFSSDSSFILLNNVYRYSSTSTVYSGDIKIIRTKNLEIELDTSIGIIKHLTCVNEESQYFSSVNPDIVKKTGEKITLESIPYFISSKGDSIEILIGKTGLDTIINFKTSPTMLIWNYSNDYHTRSHTLMQGNKLLSNADDAYLHVVLSGRFPAPKSSVNSRLKQNDPIRCKYDDNKVVFYTQNRKDLRNCCCYNSIGQKVSSQRIKNSEDNLTIFNNDLPKGMYIMCIGSQAIKFFIP